MPELDSPAHSAPLKTDFVRQVLPLIMQVNETILTQRERVVALAPDVTAGKTLSEADQRVVAELLATTRLDAWDTDEMLLRLDAVPLSSEQQSRFVSENMRRVFLMIYRIVGNVADAQDLTQEAFIKALQRQDQLKDLEKAAHWLSRIASRMVSTVNAPNTR